MKDNTEAISTTDSEGKLRSLADVEAEYVRLTLRKLDGNVSAAAKNLGIGRTTFYRRFRYMLSIDG